MNFERAYLIISVNKIRLTSKIVSVYHSQSIQNRFRRTDMSPELFGPMFPLKQLIINFKCKCAWLDDVFGM
jgi:hypothetical protein